MGLFRTIRLRGVVWRGLARFGGLTNAARRHRDTEGNDVGSEVPGRAHIAPLLREAAVRSWDLARAANLIKDGFLAGK